jgi:hypothetical protein
MMTVVADHSGIRSSFGGKGDNHRADGLLGPPRTGDLHREAIGDRRLLDHRAQHDLVHVDQMLAESFDIDLAPIRCRIGFQDPDDLGNRAEGILAPHRRCRAGHPAYDAHVLSMHIAAMRWHRIMLV